MLCPPGPRAGLVTDRYERQQFWVWPVGCDLDVQRHLDVQQVLVFTQMTGHLTFGAPQSRFQLLNSVLDKRQQGLLRANLWTCLLIQGSKWWKLLFKPFFAKNCVLYARTNCILNACQHCAYHMHTKPVYYMYATQCVLYACKNGILYTHQHSAYHMHAKTMYYMHAKTMYYMHAKTMYYMHAKTMYYMHAKRHIICTKKPLYIICTKKLHIICTQKTVLYAQKNCISYAKVSFCI